MGVVHGGGWFIRSSHVALIYSPKIVPAKTGLQGGFETPPRPPALPSGAWAIFKMYTHRCERLSPITVRIGRTDLNAHGEPERRCGFQNTTMTAAAMRFG